MKTYAIIVNGLVVNTVIGDENFPNTCEQQAVEVPENVFCSVGCKYENGQFTREVFYTEPSSNTPKNDSLDSL